MQPIIRARRRAYGLLNSLLVLCLLLAAFRCQADDYGKVTTIKVADGVYLFTTTPYAEAGFCGNSVAVIGDDGVLLFDSSALPQTAQVILSEIRKLTDKPVRYLVNSHWHWDHWGGNQVFLEANPALQIISHQKTLEMLNSVERRWNGHGLKEDLPHFLEDFEKQVAAAKAKGASEERIKSAELRLAADQNFLRQKLALHKTLPNLTFSDTLTVWLGGREVQILHARAITPGDTYIFLPKERILITGDIMLDPYPYAVGGSYPAEWIATLRRFAALDPVWVVPGHGAAQQGGKFIQKHVRLFEETMARIKDAKAKGLTAAQTTELLGKQSAELVSLVGVPADGAEKFRGYFLDTFVQRAFRELDAPLGDLPDGLPPEN